MKPACLVLMSLMLLSACTPAPTPQATQPADVPVVSTPPARLPEGVQRLEACGFAVSHPAELKPDGQGFQVMFLAQADPQVSVLIQLRRREADEAGVPLETLALHLQGRHFPEMSSLMFEPVSMTDALGTKLDGLQREISQGGVSTRLALTVRPNTLLADLLPGDVIYEFTAQAPEADWAVWGPVFEAMLQSLELRDCGGV